MSQALCKECGSKFEKVVPWKMFCGKGCKLVHWSKENRVKLNRECLKEATKALKGK